MSTVFLSYSSRDKAKAVELFNRLCAEGYSCWIDESGISPAAQWSSEIVKAIDECVVFIILLSQDALDSENVIKELSLASEGKKHIIPVNLETIELSYSVKYQLAGLQRVSYNDYSRIEKAISNIIGDPLHDTNVKVEKKSLLPRILRKFHTDSRNKIFVYIVLIVLFILTCFFLFKKTGQSSAVKAAFPTVNSEAYKLYSQALDIYQTHTKQNFLYGIQLLDAAVRLDSSFADAYALEELLCADLANDAKINKNRSIHVGTFWAKESDY